MKLDNTSPLEDNYKVIKCSGESTTIGYTVEARFNLRDPEIVNGVILDQSWRQINFDKSCIDILKRDVDIENIYEYELLSYSVAQTLRWWFHTQAEKNCTGASIGLETRLVRHLVTCTHEVKAIGVVSN